MPRATEGSWSQGAHEPSSSSSPLLLLCFEACTRDGSVSRAATALVTHSHLVCGEQRKSVSMRTCSIRDASHSDRNGLQCLDVYDLSKSVAMKFREDLARDKLSSLDWCRPCWPVQSQSGPCGPRVCVVSRGLELGQLWPGFDERDRPSSCLRAGLCAFVCRCLDSVDR